MPYMWRWQISYNGAGTFSINTVGNPVVTGTTISSTWANALTGDLATGLTTCLLKDGTQTATAAIPFANGLTTPTGYGLTAGGSQALIGYFAKRATVDQSITSNTTLASATNMSFSIAASEEWVAQANWDLGDALSTTGIKVAVTVPSGATVNLAVLIAGNTQTTPSYLTTTTGGAALDFTTTFLAGAGKGPGIISIWVLNSSNAGTVQLQIAQSTSSGTALAIRKGSFLIANRIA